MFEIKRRPFKVSNITDNVKSTGEKIEISQSLRIIDKLKHNKYCFFVN